MLATTTFLFLLKLNSFVSTHRKTQIASFVNTNQIATKRLNMQSLHVAMYSIYSNYMELGCFTRVRLRVQNLWYYVLIQLLPSPIYWCWMFAWVQFRSQGSDKNEKRYECPKSSLKREKNRCKKLKKFWENEIHHEMLRWIIYLFHTILFCVW